MRSLYSIVDVPFVMQQVWLSLICQRLVTFHYLFFHFFIGLFFLFYFSLLFALFTLILSLSTLFISIFLIPSLSQFKLAN